MSLVFVPQLHGCTVASVSVQVYHAMPSCKVVWAKRKFLQVGVDSLFRVLEVALQVIRLFQHAKLFLLADKSLCKSRYFFGSAEREHERGRQFDNGNLATWQESAAISKTQEGRRHQASQNSTKHTEVDALTESGEGELTTSWVSVRPTRISPWAMNVVHLHMVQISLRKSRNLTWQGDARRDDLRGAVGGKILPCASGARANLDRDLACGRTVRRGSTLVVGDGGGLHEDVLLDVHLPARLDACPHPTLIDDWHLEHHGLIDNGGSALESLRRGNDVRDRTGDARGHLPACFLDLHAFRCMAFVRFCPLFARAALLSPKLSLSWTPCNSVHLPGPRSLSPSSTRYHFLSPSVSLPRVD